jgi:PAS domain S-box-containing protein
LTDKPLTLKGAGGRAQGKGLAVEQRIAELERELEAARAEAAEGRFFRKLVGALTDIISVIGPDGRALFVSDAQETVIGSPPSSLVGRHVVDVIHPADYARVIKTLTEVLGSPPDRVFKAEFRRQHTDGHWIHMETVGRNFSDDPDIRGVVTSGRDVTSSVQLREQLRDTQAKYELAMRASNETPWERDLTTGAIDISPAMFGRLGYGPDEVPRSLDGFRALLHPDDRALARAGIDTSTTPGGTYDVDVRIRRKGGDYHWYRLTGTVLCDDDGLPARMVGQASDVHDRKVAEIALRDSERMFRALFEDTSVAVTIRDVDTQKFLDCNSAAVRIYGCRTRDELRDTTPEDLAMPTQPDGRPSSEVLRGYVARAMRDGVARMVWIARRRNGESFPADVRTTVITLEDGRRVMQTAIEDVTERQRSESALRNRARRDELISHVSRRFVQSAAEVALPFALEALGTFLGVSRVRMRRRSDHGATLMTIDEWRAPGVPPSTVAPQDAKAPIIRWVAEQLARHGCLVVTDVEALGPDVLGPRRMAPSPPQRGLLVVPVSDHEATSGWIVIDQLDGPRSWSDDDISTARLVAEILAIGLARTEAEGTIRRQAARDELLSEVSRHFLNDDPDAATFATLSLLGTTLGAERVSLFAFDERGGRPRRTHGWVAGRSDARSATRATNESSADDAELDAAKRYLYGLVGYGDRFFGLLRLRGTKGRMWTDDDAGTLRAIGEVIAIGRVRRAAEIALEKAKADAEAASLAKSAFLANMSHELRTPLNGVIGMVDLLGTTGLDERQRRYTEIAKASASLLLSVISDILDFSKIEAGKLEIEAIEIEFDEIVEEVAILAPSAEEKGIELSCQSSVGLTVPLVGDPARLRQVLVNLVSNAIKFTRAGEVSVRASLVSESDDEARVRVEVSDTGAGIPFEAQAKLFQPFVQLDATTTREHGGTGLGLAICRELIERMSGTIGLTSVPGAGSTFWFEVPLVKARSRPARGDESHPRLAGLRVLSVDDNATSRSLLRAKLSAAGMQCDTAVDGYEALQMLTQAALARPYALVVVDCHMPGMNGRDFARRVAANDRLRGTRVIMLGPVTNPLDASEQRAAGLAGYSTKPVWRKQLLGVLEAALDGKAASDPRGRDSAHNAPQVPAHLLLVEDSPVNAEVAAEIVRSAGYTFDVASDGVAAIAATKARAYDLVLMDCQLPEIDGYEATRRIRALEREGALPAREDALPVIALTASALKGDLERCFAAGMNDYVSKPIDARRLLAIVARHLKGSLTTSLRRSRSSIAVIDLERALGRLQGDRTLLRRIASQFADGVPEVRAKLRAAVGRRDTSAVAFDSHRLRGQASSFGGEALVMASEALEDAARQAEWPAATDALVAVDGELDRFLRALATSIATL